jgi:membrane associated rhomboid family serine protease
MLSFLTPWVKRLIVVNVAAFILTSYFVPGIQQFLAFYPHWEILRVMPWTFVTYMFVHANWGHLIFNMISFGFFGPRVEAQMGGGRFLTMYFVAGLGGAVLSLILQKVAPYPIVGASGAIFGVELVYATLWPRDRIYIWGAIPVEARWLVIGQTVYSIFGGFGGLGNIGGGVAHFAHLGGYAGAFLYLRWIDYRSPLRAYQRKLDTATFGKRGWGLAGDVEEIARWEAIPRAGLHVMNVEELDRVIAKAKKAGVRSLTADERAFLHRMSLRETPADVKPPIQ